MYLRYFEILKHPSCCKLLPGLATRSVALGTRSLPRHRGLVTWWRRCFACRDHLPKGTLSGYICSHRCHGLKQVGFGRKHLLETCALLSMECDDCTYTYTVCIGICSYARANYERLRLLNVVDTTFLAGSNHYRVNESKAHRTAAMARQWIFVGLIVSTAIARSVQNSSTHAFF